MHYRKARLDRRFWRLWGAAVTSSLGTGILAVAFPLLALGFTHNPLSISGVVIAAQAPGLFVALPFGAIADRLNRRSLIVGIQLIRFLVLAVFGSLVLMHHDGLLLIYITVFLLGGLTVAFDVTANACVPSIVDDDNLVKANAHLLNAELTSENLLGQGLGGAAVALLPALPFLAQAGGLLASAALLEGAVPDVVPEKSDTAIWQDLKEGVRWFWGHTFLRLQALILGSVVFGQGMVLGLLALYARKNLHLTSSGYGLLLAVASIGTVAGGLLAAKLNERVNSGLAIVLAALVMAAGYPVLAVTHSALVAAGALVAEEAGVIIASTASRSLRQRLVPPEMQGRLMSAFFVVIMACLPLGALASGVIGKLSNVSTAFICAGVFDVVLLALIGPRLLRQSPGRERPTVRMVNFTSNPIDLTESAGSEAAESAHAV